MPSIKAVTAELIGQKFYLDDEITEMDVRLQVHENGAWEIHTGDSQYDLDHRGFWGASYLTKSTNCRECAKDLIDKAMDHKAQCWQ
jgi:hypothetical protein